MMLKSRLLLLIVLVVIVSQPVLSFDRSALLAGQIDFAAPDHPETLNPALIWDTGQQAANRYSLTEYPGKLLLTSESDELLGPAVCTTTSGDFAASVHVEIAPNVDSQGGGIFVRVPGTWETYIGIARSLDADLHSIGSWGLYDAITPLRAKSVAFIAREADLSMTREDGLLTLAYKGGATRTWREVRSEFAFELPDEVEICVNLWSADPEQGFSGLFDTLVVTGGGLS